ncbi:hypothetical protein FRC09_015910 [Ceratobasidium sp. 395]|nr:hypothetical protein FRC09_015910 [Ceratobasidium sp. 395]
MVYPKPAVYYASWPDLIRATRNTLSEAVQKGTEWASSWKIQLAEREGAAMARLARREMRRVRMWRRQEREALTRGYIAEDVGVRRKEKGTGVKKRRANREKPRPGVGRENLKILRAPSRVDFKEGHFSTRNSSVKPSLNRSPKRISKISGLETVSSQKKPHIPNVHSFPDVTSSVPALKAGAKVRTNRRPADYNRTPKTIYSSQIGDTSLSADATNTKLPSHDLDFKATHAWKSATRVGKQKK